jgi:uncharacterized protein
MDLHLSFHMMMTLVYIIPNIYVFLRIGKLFINKDYKIRYSFIYILLALICPVSFFFGRDISFPANLFTIISDYLLPFYLYLFLFVLIYDILLIINRLFKIIPDEKRISTCFKTTCFSTILLLSALVVVAGIINFNTIRTTEYNICVPGKSSRIKHLRIAFASDFHLKKGTNIRFVKRFTEMISEVNPDIMLFGGDIIEGDRDDGEMSKYENLLKKISPKYGVYGVLGNHEYYAGQDKGSFFNNAGIKILCDTVIVIDNSFNLAGRYDSHFKARKAVNDLVEQSIDSLPVILLDHRPTEIDQVSRTSADIQLSGHTHHGQLFPVNWITEKVYQLSWGYQKIGSTHFFVTSGIRLWGPPVRTTAKSEIMVINVTFTGQ